MEENKNKITDLRVNILKGYLKEYAVKPNLSSGLWDTAKACVNSDKSFFAVKFMDDLSMRQFGQAVLLSSGKQFNWFSTKSYSLVQDNLNGDRLLTGYGDFDVVFIIHEKGTLFNKILGQCINQVAVLRSPLKTFLFHRDGFVISDLIVPVVSVSELGGCVKGLVKKGEDL